MSISPQEALQRTDWALSDVASNGGEPPPEVLSPFLSRLYNTPTIFKAATQVEMTSQEMKIPNILFDSQVLMASPGDNLPLADADRSAPTSGQVDLVAQEYVGEVNLPYTILESNVEREKLQDTIMAHIAERASLDLALCAVHGDTTLAADTAEHKLLRVQDGWFKKAGHVVDAQGANIDRTIMRAWFKGMPAKHMQRDQGQTTFYLNYNAAVDWQDSVAARMTPGGDNALASGAVPPFFMRKVEPDATIKIQDSNGYTQVTQGLFTQPKNLIVGFHRKITIEVLRQPRQRNIVIVISLRAAFDFFLEDAAVRLDNVLPKDE